MIYSTIQNFKDYLDSNEYKDETLLIPLFSAISQLQDNKTFENEYVKFGGIVRFGRKAGLLISYKLHVDTIEAMFDNEDFEYFKQGDLSLAIGAAFGGW